MSQHQRLTSDHRHHQTLLTMKSLDLSVSKNHQNQRLGPHQGQISRSIFPLVVLHIHNVHKIAASFHKLSQQVDDMTDKDANMLHKPEA